MLTDDGAQISGLPTGEYKVVEDEDCLVYSGFYQTEKINDMIKVLENKNVLNYVLENGSKKSGGFAAFSKKLLRPFIQDA